MIVPHPPSGQAGDTFDSSLELVNRASAQLGLGAHDAVGWMRLSYTVRHQCASAAPSCIPRADFMTVSTLPGGTVIANGKGISTESSTITIPIVAGTGSYRGARGTLLLGPSWSTYALVLP